MVVEGRSFDDMQTQRERLLESLVRLLGDMGISCRTCACWERIDGDYGTCAMDDLGTGTGDLCSWWTEKEEDDG